MGSFGDAKSFLCLVINRHKGSEIAEYTINAINDYYAKTQAAKNFVNDQRYQKKLRQEVDWYVDACEI